MKYEVHKYIACERCKMLVGVGGTVSMGREDQIRGNLNKAYRAMSYYNTSKRCCQAEVVIIK